MLKIGDGRSQCRSKCLVTWPHEGCLGCAVGDAYPPRFDACDEAAARAPVATGASRGSFLTMSFSVGRGPIRTILSAHDSHNVWLSKTRSIVQSQTPVHPFSNARILNRWRGERAEAPLHRNRAARPVVVDHLFFISESLVIEGATATLGDALFFPSLSQTPFFSRNLLFFRAVGLARKRRVGGSGGLGVVRRSRAADLRINSRKSAFLAVSGPIWTMDGVLKSHGTRAHRGSPIDRAHRGLPRSRSVQRPTDSQRIPNAGG